MRTRYLMTAAAVCVAAHIPMPATASADRPPSPSARIGTPMCVDVSNNRGNGILIYQWQCGGTNTNQKFSIENGLIKVADTVGKIPQMCLDSSNARTNGTRVYQWQCLSNANQLWTVKNGVIMLSSTQNTSNQLCLDATNNRGNGTQIYLWQCNPDNTNQKFVIQDGQIALKDTLS
ncbi:hypothetical protein GCM10009677_58420 [Sphaerisporangium rubeum]|uniref:Outer membrane protein assembly factor BamB n=1 Tax=Sphaerisporangium rubeum TaxID=321317 RepID=A0A7X0IMK7_9ACTN|nr:RICIN domain-containing protein [Sphaerisporangium rubeum]MBB6476788.1 outer membrane protein assembly factor BamB [Sphaerisporangium rubeum]